MATKVKIKLEEEMQPSTSGRGVQLQQEEEVMTEVEGEYDSDEIDDKYLTAYCESAEIPQAMTISKKLFYTDEMVARNYQRLSRKDKERFNQMQELVEAIKRETGDYSLIGDLMSRVVAQHFGGMGKEDVKAVMGREGEGIEGEKKLKKEGDKLVIKTELGAEPEKVVVTAILPSEEPALIPYCVVEDEGQSDCETIGSNDSQYC